MDNAAAKKMLFLEKLATMSLDERELLLARATSAILLQSQQSIGLDPAEPRLPHPIRPQACG